ncbi:MAG: transporter substrate-binding domain-containing protein [Lachnospiraceae bacterium]|nr:transporter substrate-binding domain-containing protein [Lachnospiraceae bacterium]
MNVKEGKKSGLLLFLMLLMLVLSGCGKSSSDSAVRIDSLDDIHNVRFGLVTGALDEVIYAEKFSDCTPFYFNGFNDEVAALKENKIDCMFYESSGISALMSETDGITYIEESVYEEQFSMPFAKDTPRGQKLCAEFDEFIGKLEESGELKELEQDWTDNFETKVIDYSGITGENGKVIYASPFDAPPFNFVKNGEPSGFEVDLFVRYCTEYGYEPEIQSMDFGALIPAITSGKIDLGSDYICVTEERKQSVAFPRAYATGDVYVVVRAEAEKVSFLDSIANGFRKTFIEEQRWKMILSGICTTLLISIASIIIGSVLGFLIYLLCRKGPNWITSFFDGLSWVVSSLPTVVLLMLMFYVVFGKSQIAGFWVSIITFSIFMAMGVYSALSTAVKSIDSGQLEGAYSLGFSDTRTFMMIILPQAMEQFIPNYKGLVVSLVQGTSIVGYIAVEDLTRISDIIRGRTYEAFFPLVSTAIIYLILCWLLTLLISRINLHITPASRSKEEIMRRFEK